MEILSIINIAVNIILGVAILSTFGIIFGLLYRGIDRKLSFALLKTPGPCVLQSFRDISKLFKKENIVPENSIPWIFNFAPMVGFVAILAILFYIPVGGFEPLLSTDGDVILVVYLLLISSIALPIGGFSSGSRYAAIGSQREIVKLISYIFPFLIVVIGIVWAIDLQGVDDAFAFSVILSNPVWNFVGPLGFIGFVIMLFVTITIVSAQLSKTPFDDVKSDSEIAGGALAEYSGRNLAMFYLTDSVKLIVLSSIVVALFFPYNLSSLLGIQGCFSSIIDFVFYLVKVFVIIFFTATLARTITTRKRTDQVLYAYWTTLTLAALVGLICIMWDVWTMNQFGLQTLTEMINLI